MCEALLDPAFGEVVSRSNVIGSIASYECLPGYVLSGDRTRICMRNGMWTGDPPTCQREYIRSSRDVNCDNSSPLIKVKVAQFGTAISLAI